MAYKGVAATLAPSPFRYFSDIFLLSKAPETPVKVFIQNNIKDKKGIIRKFQVF